MAKNDRFGFSDYAFNMRRRIASWKLLIVWLSAGAPLTPISKSNIIAMCRKFLIRQIRKFR